MIHVLVSYANVSGMQKFYFQERWLWSIQHLIYVLFTYTLPQPFRFTLPQPFSTILHPQFHTITLSLPWPPPNHLLHLSLIYNPQTLIYTRPHGNPPTTHFHPNPALLHPLTYTVLPTHPSATSSSIGEEEEREAYKVFRFNHITSPLIFSSFYMFCRAETISSWVTVRGWSMRRLETSSGPMTASILS